MNSKILQWNARGLIRKWAEVKQMFVDEDFQVICLQETHFIENSKYTFNLPRFSLYNAYSDQGNWNGGVSLYVSNHLPHMQLHIQSTLQVVACSVRMQNRRITICSLYLPPNDVFSFQDLSQLIDQLPKPLIICADANSKHSMWGSGQCDRRGMILMNVVNHHDLHILNDGQPTRLDDSTGNTSHIDITLASSEIAHILDWNTDGDLHSSDHFPIHVQFCASNHVPNLPPIFYGWNTRKANWTEFRTNCDFTFDVEEGVNNCETITQAIIEQAQNFIPTRNGNSKYQCPWWTSECKDAIRMRRRAQNRMRRDPYSEFLRIEYRKAKAKTRQVLRNAQVSSWRNLLSIFNHRTPMSKLWDILRKFSNKTRIMRPLPVLKHHDDIIDEPLAVANLFGTHFAEMSSSSNYSQAFLTHENDIKDSMPDFGTDNRQDYNQEFTLKELTDAINRSGSTSIGPDKIHYDFFRHLNDDQLKELLHFYNFLWTSEVFPDAWRHSYIIPILKPGKDRNQLQSYRPIQLTSCMCKLLERMIGKRLAWCLESQGLLSKYQCAFRSGRSTDDHLVRLDSHIREGFLHHSNTLAVFLDIKSAYNMVSPVILLKRMHHLGFRGHMMHFIRGYLERRTFQVRCGVLSDVFDQKYGVVQGGVISPILFNIAIDSLIEDIPQNVSTAIYADDCTIWAQGRHITQVFRKVQTALSRIGTWSEQNGFIFSPSKTSAVLFRRGLKRVDRRQIPTLHLLNRPISLVDQVRYLGVILDSKLNLNAHVEHIKGRAQQRLSILKCVAGKSFGADRIILLRMYKSLIRPILEYASSILDGPRNRRVESLEVIQNAALRIATGALRTSPVTAVQVDTNVEPLKVRRQDLLLRYYLKVKGNENHPCRGIMDIDSYSPGYRGLSERYLKRICGFSVSYRLQENFRTLEFNPPQALTPSAGTIAPWLLHRVSTLMLLDGDKRRMTETDIQTEFAELISKYPGYRILYTDGSKMGTSVAYAFTVNNAFFSNRLGDGMSIYTAELVAIREALHFVWDNQVPKALIFSDSQSAVRALAGQSREHPVLVDILESNHNITEVGMDCVVVWIPGHSGIRGNVRADFWAKKAHDKPTVKQVNVGYREFVPQVRKRTRDLFAKIWQDYRPTQLKEIKPNIGHWKSSVRDNRKEEVVLCRMRIGHTVFTHSYIIDQVPETMCDTCRCRLNVRHVLLECRKFIRFRQELLTVCQLVGVRMSLKTLLGDGDLRITEALFEFLRRCNLIDKL